MIGHFEKKEIEDKIKDKKENKKSQNKHKSLLKPYWNKDFHNYYREIYLSEPNFEKINLIKKFSSYVLVLIIIATCLILMRIL